MNKIEEFFKKELPYNMGIHKGAGDITGDWFFLAGVDLLPEPLNSKFYRTLEEAIDDFPNVLREYDKWLDKTLGE